MSRFQWFIVLLCLVLLTNCTTRDGECHEEMKTALGCELYATSYDPIEEIYRPASATMNATAYGIGTDSLLYDNTSVNKLSLPLNAFDTISQFVVCCDSLANDTLAFYYTVRNNVISLECGCKPEFIIRYFSHTTHAIDSVIQLSDEVIDLNTSQIRIYFSPR
ncbi:MAG: DUF6452 family protein [Bacteroidales bacterium]|nr:DUF6452 family protein [Bacteroidales bacterium]